ncbi:MAG: hypothetical protein M3162_06930 [Thermoproteota archaeon]|nr:hypothetical protein [Thermoproteota archaeon]
MSSDIEGKGQIIRPFIVFTAIFLLLGSFIGSIWLVSISTLNFPFLIGHTTIFSLHEAFQMDTALTLLVMGIGFMIIPRFRNVPIGSTSIIKASFLMVITSAVLSSVPVIHTFGFPANENIFTISSTTRLIGVLLFTFKVIDTLRIKPRLLRISDYFIGFSTICLLITSILDLLQVKGNPLANVEIQLLFPLTMIFGIQYKTLPAFLGFIRPKKKSSIITFLLLLSAFLVGIVSKTETYTNVDDIVFNILLLSSAFTFSFSVFLYSTYENKKYLLQSSGEKRTRYFYTLNHTRIAFYFLFIGIVFGILYHIDTNNKFVFYDLCIHLVAIGFIGITIASYLPMMLPPILGKKINFLKFSRIPLILIVFSLFLRSIGMMLTVFYDSSSSSDGGGGGGSYIISLSLGILPSISGFILIAAIIIYMRMIHKSLEK